MSGFAVIRFISIGLFGASIVICILLALDRENSSVMKLGWLAALLLVFAIDPGKLPPLGVPIPTLGFYRAVFGALTVVLVLAALFVIFFIQLPHERIPHYRGTIAGMVDAGADRSFPEVRYYTSDGQAHTFVDRIAPIMYPQRRFSPGEPVTIVLVSAQHPRIDEPALARWSTAAIVLVCAVFAATLTLVAHLRYTAILQ